ncbi:hypothetical protein DPMN_130735 [Dreissena polymorpha]|uniref:Uncharacterized protein n=1 Tax=Dreissena polymorpha TaxID=45954 RepID=A0A9D4HBJ2_DREPO|nr:hypothetical protein DPMN_130735 [Dreissena polymorpha]
MLPYSIIRLLVEFPQDVPAVNARLEQIRTKLGERALPLMRKKSVISRWRMAAKITLLHRGFVQNYIETQATNPRVSIEIFPYHLIVDKLSSVIPTALTLHKPILSVSSAVLSSWT